MDYEDSVKETKAVKAKIRADMVKNVIVAVGSSNGIVQIWNPLQANEMEQYTSTSGMSVILSYLSPITIHFLHKLSLCLFTILLSNTNV